MSPIRRIDRLVTAVTAALPPGVASGRGLLVRRALGTFALLLLFGGTLQAQTVTLAWDANTEPDLAGYVVYYGTTSGAYTNSINVGILTTTIIGGLNVGQPYYFAVKAYDTDGNYSPYSNEVNSASPASAQLTTPAPGSTLTGSTVTFQWTAGINVPSYQLTVGTTPGGGNLFDQVVGSTLSTTVAGLPTNGSTVYVRLWSLVGTIWVFRDYTYTAATPPNLTINNVSVTEGNSSTRTATLTVTLTPTSTQTVTVSYATADGTATAGSDYVAKSGTLTFAAGASTQPIVVTVNGDTTFEPNETFFVNLSSATNATIGDAQGVGTIVNDDAAPAPTVSVSPATVNPGDVITVTVANGPGNMADWVTIGLVTAPDSGYAAWKYLNGLTSPPATGLTSATVQFMAPTAPGTYHIRWFANDTYTRLATSNTVTVQATQPPPPTVSVSPATVNPGDVITATVANGPGNVADWVTIGLATAPDSGYAAWKYLNGLTSPPATGLTGATVQFTAPTTPGTYHIRWFANGTYARLATSSTVTVQATQPLTPTVSVSPATVNPGDVITATVANGPGNVADWVTIGLVTAPDSGYAAWKYLNGLTSPPATGLTSAMVQFTAPTAPGTYHIRWFANGTYARLATSSTLTVQGLATTLMVSPTTVRQGDTITVTVLNGPGSVADWVAFSPTGAPDSGYIAWEYLSGSMFLPPAGLTNATLQFTAPSTPGTYNFRFYANNTYSRLATSVTVTVQ